jgi:hypothetical protein
VAAEPAITLTQCSVNIREFCVFLARDHQQKTLHAVFPAVRLPGNHFQGMCLGKLLTIKDSEIFDEIW